MKTANGGLKLGKYTIHPIRIFDRNLSTAENFNTKPVAWEVYVPAGNEDFEVLAKLSSEEEAIAFVESIR